ncbi:Arylsulfatase [Pontiella sulfatireligans]|uniref:Arylsulfatase n=2 Tax=Pontiella sulfatireligans TaxID=2750658 RepID=A0A6C2USB4_9BACT|nr:sulfatase S1_24 [Kiritimatiellales bacterium]VGO23148.1 Arylsulfatase [Pontiella sulfatireligans]
MKLWLFLMGIGLAIQCAAQPNVIVIMADDFGFECVETYGGESYSTPRMNQMAVDGVKFNHAHAQPICTPSRVQIMTGKYNVRNYTKFATLDQSQDTFGHPFRNAGYSTCVVGKWQLGGTGQTIEDFGFDEHCLWSILSTAERYVSPDIVTNGVKQNYPGQYGPDIQHAYAKDFILRNTNTPFYLYYPITLTHSPFQPTPDSADWDPNRDPYFSDPVYFGDMVAYLDKLLGDLLDFLETTGLAENTLVIFTGDNGTDRLIYSVQNGVTVQGGKGLTTDAGTHVPMLISWPGTVQSNLVVNDIVDFADIYTTLIDAADVPVDPAVAAEKDGVSFLPLMNGQAGMPRDHSYCWYMRRTDMTEIHEFVQDQTYKLYATGDFHNKTLDLLEQSPLSPTSLTSEETTLKTYFDTLLLQYGALRPDGIPYNNSVPYSVPGTIEAERYDFGLDGITYHDTTADSNVGGTTRTDDVDIHTINNATVVDEIATGEWLEYSVDVDEAGTYAFAVRYAAESVDGRLHFEIGGESVSGTLDLPATGSVSNYATAVLDEVQLPGGECKLTVVFDQPGMNIDLFTATYVGEPVAPPVAPVTVWSEDFETTPPNVEQTANFILGGSTPTPDFDTNVWAVTGNPTLAGFDENPGAATTLASYDAGVPRLRAVGIVLGAETFTAGNGTYRLVYDVALSGIADLSNDYGQILIYSGAGYNNTDSAYTMDVTRLAPQVISFEGSGSASASLLADSGKIGATAVKAELEFEYTGGDVSLTFASSGATLALWDNLSVFMPGSGALQFSGWVTQFPTLGSQTNSIDNPDGDTLNNLYEFALGGIPTNGAHIGHVPVFQTLEEGGTNWFEYVYARRKNPAEHGLHYYLVKNTNLVSSIWSVASNEVVAAELDEDFEVVSNRFPTNEEDAQFIHLKIEEISL